MFLTPVKYRLAAVLAVLSILLLFIAPLISQSLYFSSTTRESHTEQTCAEPMGSEGMSEMMNSQSMSVEKSDHTQLPASGMLCGYCELLVHFPFFVWLSAAILWLIAAISLTPLSFLYQTIVLIACYPSQRLRGPPQVIS